MNGKEFTITGWPAVIVGILVLAFGGIRYATARTSLDAQGVEALNLWIVSEYSRYHLDNTDPSQENYSEIMAAVNDIKVASISARGKPKDTIVKVILEPNIAHPPDMPTTLYYEMSYSSLLGWQYERKARAREYHRKIF